MSQGRPSFLKREREKSKRERREKKAARRQENAAARQSGTPDRPEGEDPDIAGIRLGPQPPQEE